MSKSCLLFPAWFASSVAGYLSIGLQALQAQPLTFTEYPVPTPRSQPYKITRGPDGALWFTEGGGIGEGGAGKIGRISGAGVITEYALPGQVCCTGTHGIVAGPDGALWFTEPVASRIGRITTSGSITEYNIRPGYVPLGIALGSDGALWFAEYGIGQIGRITTSGVITEYRVPFSAPSEITAGPDGALWFTDLGALQIGRITTAGLVTVYPISTLNSGGGDIAAGPDGALWFTGPYANRIWRITTAGVISEYPLGTTAAGIVAGPDGALWFTEYLAGKIGRITTAGVVTEYPVPTPSSGPNGITVGPDKAIWFTEWPGGKIGRAVPVTAERAYVSNYYTQNVSVIDLASNTAIATIDIPAQAHAGGAIAINPLGTRVYVGGALSSSDQLFLSVIDTTTNTVLAVIDTGVVAAGIAVHPAAPRVYVASVNTPEVVVIDAMTNSVVTRLPFPTQPTDVAFRTNTTELYVATTAGFTIIDTNTNSTKDSIPLPGVWYGMTFNAAGTRLYAADAFQGISVVDTGSRTVSAVFPVGYGATPTSIALSPSGTRLYVNDQFASAVRVFNPNTDTLVDTIPMTVPPGPVALNLEGTRLYVGTNGNSYTDLVTIVDTASDRVIGSVAAGSGPAAIVVGPREGQGILSFRFEEGDGTVLDQSGNGNNGVVDGPVFSPAQGVCASNAFRFAWSKADKIVVPYSDSQLVTDNLTLEAWIYPTGWDNIYAGYNRIVSKWPAYMLRGNSGHAHFQVGTASHGYVDLIAPELLSLNQWHYLVGTSDGQSFNLYVDGFPKGSLRLPQPDTAVTNPFPIQVGEWGRLNEGFTGIIDNVAVSREVKSPAEVASSYQAIAPCFCAANLTSKFTIVRSGFRYDRATNRYLQTLTIKRNTATVAEVPPQGPFALVLDGLSTNATLYRASGVTTCAWPAGSPYLGVPTPTGGWQPGASVSVNLEFINPANLGIIYNARMLAGGAIQ